MELHGQLHAGKWVDHAVYAASLDGKVSNGSRMAELVLVLLGGGDRHRESWMLSGDHGRMLSPYEAMLT